jgi:hypothetical protein
VSGTRRVGRGRPARLYRDPDGGKGDACFRRASALVVAMLNVRAAGRSGRRARG